ncbi:hypothetical protein [Parasedimentitalea psychrophila]|uniref:Uncharacterized protein n=1 Tax=Parasedimentitalea psychrophila TaxID=2997337 RepID=A0A9Y2L2D7_9RHOB|nr:hypothetical protein [Parasedimentitalea psychrophila]WIY26769.1 hypothetical protein QPJ95_07585 [Parasedimentitalea psychrophila]
MVERIARSQPHPLQIPDEALFRGIWVYPSPVRQRIGQQCPERDNRSFITLQGGSSLPPGTLQVQIKSLLQTGLKATQPVAQLFAAAKMELGTLNSDMSVANSGEDCGGCVSDENSSGACELIFHSSVSFLNADNIFRATQTTMQSARVASGRLETGITLGLDPSPPRTTTLIQ